MFRTVSLRVNRAASQLSVPRWNRALSTVETQHNFYELLGVDETFEVDTSVLADRFKQLQRQWHPDKFGRSSESDQQSAADMSARINEAYGVLRIPYKRAKHLLHIRSGEDFEEDGLSDDVLNGEFLMWVVDIREKIADADGSADRLATIRPEIDETMQQCLQNLARAFENNNLDAATEETVKLQYLRRMEQAIEDASQ